MKLSPKMSNLKINLPSEKQNIQNILQISAEQIENNKDFAQITEALYIGNGIISRDIDQLNKLCITHIINTSPQECENEFPDQLKYIDIELQEEFDHDILMVIQIILEFIDEALQDGGKVLIASQQGKNRAPTLALAYLIHKNNQNLSQSLQYLKSVYPRAEPNLDFQIQLQEFSNQEQERLQKEKNEQRKQQMLEEQSQNRRKSLQRFLNREGSSSNNNMELLLEMHQKNQQQNNNNNDNKNLLIADMDLLSMEEVDNIKQQKQQKSIEEKVLKGVQSVGNKTGTLNEQQLQELQQKIILSKSNSTNLAVQEKIQLIQKQQSLNKGSSSFQNEDECL